MLLDAFRAVRERYARAMLLLAPRHPERFDCGRGAACVVGIALRAALAMETAHSFQARNEWGTRSVSAARLALASWRASTSSPTWPSSAAAWFRKGGHNVLEPAYFGVPILVGPLHRELPRHRRDLPPRRCAARRYSADAHARPCSICWTNYDERERLGRNAQEVMRRSRAQPGEPPRRCLRCCRRWTAEIPLPTRPAEHQPLESPLSRVRRCGPRAQRVLRSRHVSGAPAARAGRQHRQSLDRRRGQDAVPASAGRAAEAAQHPVRRALARIPPRDQRRRAGRSCRHGAAVWR